MNRYQNRFVFGLCGSLVIALSGCAGGGGGATALEDAVASAQAALEEELPGIPGHVEPLSVHNGVPVVQYHAPEGSSAPYTGAYGYGGWLGQRGFAVYSAPAAGMVGIPFVLAEEADESDGAPGDVSGYSATWSGVMLGVDTTSTDDDAGVRGEAELELHSGMGTATVDVEFSDVVGIQSEDAYGGHSWTGVSVPGSSFSGTSGEGGTVDGTFYGDHHEDVIGEFAYDNLTGTWGASRMAVGDAGMGGDDEMGDDNDMGNDMDGDDDMGGDMGNDMDGDDMGNDMDGDDDMGNDMGDDDDDDDNT